MQAPTPSSGSTHAQQTPAGIHGSSNVGPAQTATTERGGSKKMFSRIGMGFMWVMALLILVVVGYQIAFDSDDTTGKGASKSTGSGSTAALTAHSNQTTMREVIAPVGRWSVVVEISDGRCVNDKKKITEGLYRKEIRDKETGRWVSPSTPTRSGFDGIRFQSNRGTESSVIVTDMPESACR